MTWFVDKLGPSTGTPGGQAMQKGVSVPKGTPAKHGLAPKQQAQRAAPPPAEPPKKKKGWF